MVLNEEIDSFLKQIVNTNDDTLLIRTPQTLLNIVCNKFAPFKHIEFGQPEYKELGEGKVKGSSALQKVIKIKDKTIAMDKTYGDLKEFLTNNKE